MTMDYFNQRLRGLKDKKLVYGFEISVLNKTAAEMFEDI